MEPDDRFGRFRDGFDGPVGAEAPSCKLAAALAERLEGVLGPPLTIRAAGPDLDLHAHDRHIVRLSTPRLVGDEDDRTLGEKVETAVLSVLSTVQDEFSYYLVAQWPADSVGRMAMANARVEADRVYLWYGDDEATAAITLAPIELADLTG